MKVISHAKPQA